jgi:hypothetical protein
VTADPRRTFWDKVIIAHGQRQWFEDRGELKGGGLRLTRHYYDLHMLLASKFGQEALQNVELCDDVVRHARMFFDRKPFGLDKAVTGDFTVDPSPEVLSNLAEDYRKMSGMIFGDIPIFEDVMASISALQEQLAPDAAYRPTFP